MEIADNRAQKAIQRLLPNARVAAQAVMLDGTDLLQIDAGHGPIPLRTRWIGFGWPKDVRSALDAVGTEGEWPADLVLVARHLSPGAVQLLTERQANWADESGQAQIAAPGIVISRFAAQPIEVEREFGWSSSALEIAELLLSQSWKDGFGNAELATLTGWSAPQVSQVLQAFDARGWTLKYGPRRGRGARRELVDPDGLLQEWAAAISEEPPLTREASASFTDSLAFLREQLAPALDEHVRWAVSGWAASEELAPFLTAVPTLQIYVHEDDMFRELDVAIREAGLREVPEGGRVQFSMASSGVMGRAQRRRGLPLASGARIWADLQRMGPRGAEAADHLKEEVLDRILGRAPATEPPERLVDWERESRARLQQRVEKSPGKTLGSRYAHGTWSSSYILDGVTKVPTLPEFKALLRKVVERETGWPAWLLPDGTPGQLRPVGGTIECWLDDTVLDDPGHTDFWRGDPRGRMCLIRGYQEDGRDTSLEPGTSFDLTLPVWRAGECLLHASRLARELDAARVQFMMRWEGLEGRVLTAFASQDRVMAGEYRCFEPAVTSFVETSPDAIESELAELVKALVAPVYTAFDFFEPPAQLYEQELTRMRDPVRG